MSTRKHVNTNRHDKERKISKVNFCIRDVEIRKAPSGT